MPRATVRVAILAVAMEEAERLLAAEGKESPQRQRVFSCRPTVSSHNIVLSAYLYSALYDPKEDKITERLLDKM